MIVTVLAIAAALDLTLELAKYLVKRTKTPTDDKVVAFVEKNKAAVVAYLAKALPEAPKPGPRPPVVDHRK